MLSTPRNRRSAYRPSRARSACGPDSENEFERSTPPSMIRCTCGVSASSSATLSALVMTLTERSGMLRSCLAISAVVEPESRMMVSPSPINRAAAAAMRTFCARCRLCFTVRFRSSLSRSASAPPRARTTAPKPSSTLKSLRIVTVDTPKRAASWLTPTRPWRSTSSRMLPRRASTAKVEASEFDIDAAGEGAAPRGKSIQRAGVAERRTVDRVRQILPFEEQLDVLVQIVGGRGRHPQQRIGDIRQVGLGGAVDRVLAGVIERQAGADRPLLVDQAQRGARRHHRLQLADVLAHDPGLALDVGVLDPHAEAVVVQVLQAELDALDQAAVAVDRHLHRVQVAGHADVDVVGGLGGDEILDLLGEQRHRQRRLRLVIPFSDKSCCQALVGFRSGLPAIDSSYTRLMVWSVWVCASWFSAGRDITWAASSRSCSFGCSQ